MSPFLASKSDVLPHHFSNLLVLDPPTGMSDTNGKVIPEVSSLWKVVFANRSFLAKLEISEVSCLPQALSKRRGYMGGHFELSLYSYLPSILNWIQTWI